MGLATVAGTKDGTLKLVATNEKSSLLKASFVT
jgi:hypothetical protein